MAKNFEVKDNKLIFRNNGNDFIEETDAMVLDHFEFDEIVFPECFIQLYDCDFEYCEDQISSVRKLDFSKADNIKTIEDGTFDGAASLKVVVLPKKVEYIPEFNDCPQLQEFHIYNLDDTYAITNDKDKRLVVYASNVGIISSFSNDFLADVGVLYVPEDDIERLQDALDTFDDELELRPLPEGYSFPTEALSEPWEASSLFDEFAESLRQAAEEILHKQEEELEKAEELLEQFNFKDLFDAMQYYCVIDNQSFGPLNIQQFANMARFGIVDSNTLVWKDGMPSWAPASSIPEISIALI